MVQHIFTEQWEIIKCKVKSGFHLHNVFKTKPNSNICRHSYILTCNGFIQTLETPNFLLNLRYTILGSCKF